MKKIKAAIVGYGNRGYIYSRYAVNNPERLEIVAVCDHDNVKLNLAKKGIFAFRRYAILRP